MPLKRREDDLFTDKTMSFGEHLEELRSCLIYSILWLLGGFLVGLYFGGPAVDYVQRPMTFSLEKYYLDRDTAQLEKAQKELLEEGHSRSVLQLPTVNRMVPHEFWVYPGELERHLAYQQKMERDALLTGTPFITLDDVDNLIVRKKEREELRKRQAEGQGLLSHAPVTDYNAPPGRLLLWTKIENDARTRTKSFNAHEVFSIYIKASLMVGFVLASPFIFYHIWSFIAAGLYPHERNYVYFFMPFSIALFVGGAFFAFFIVFPFILEFLFWFNTWTGIDPEARITEWLSFAMMLPIGFGISFQLPLVMFVLERVNIFSVELYASQWKISVLVIAFISMILTPADPWSMLLMAVPLIGLYFVGIWMCKLFPKNAKFEEYAESV